MRQQPTVGRHDRAGTLTLTLIAGVQMKSPIADMKNAGGRYGGAITAALFLRHFVDTDKARGCQHAHLRLPESSWLRAPVSLEVSQAAHVISS